jgi:hypothetical protein
MLIIIIMLPIKVLYADVVTNAARQKSTLRSYITHVHASHVDSMCFKAPRPFLCSGCPSRGIELLMRVRLRCLCLHARTSTYRGRRANPATACPACGAANKTLSQRVGTAASSALDYQQPRTLQLVQSVTLGTAQR